MDRLLAKQRQEKVYEDLAQEKGNVILDPKKLTEEIHTNILVQTAMHLKENFGDLSLQELQGASAIVRNTATIVPPTNGGADNPEDLRQSFKNYLDSFEK